MRLTQIVVLLFVTGFSDPASAQEKGTTDPSRAAPSAELRMKLLKGGPMELGLDAPTSAKTVFGVLMETGYPKAVATLAALTSGDASLYFSTGGGVFGGGQHPSVAAAAKRFVLLANDYLPNLTRTENYPLPGQGSVAFYLITTNGVLTAVAPVDDLEKKRHRLSGLFYEGQRVITELRLVAERQPTK